LPFARGVDDARKLVKAPLTRERDSVCDRGIATVHRWPRSADPAVHMSDFSGMAGVLRGPRPRRRGHVADLGELRLAPRTTSPRSPTRGANVGEMMWFGTPDGPYGGTGGQLSGRAPSIREPDSSGERGARHVGIAAVFSTESLGRWQACPLASAFRSAGVRFFWSELCVGDHRARVASPLARAASDVHGWRFGGRQSIWVGSGGWVGRRGVWSGGVERGAGDEEGASFPRPMPFGRISGLGAGPREFLFRSPPGGWGVGGLGALP